MTRTLILFLAATLPLLALTGCPQEPVYELSFDPAPVDFGEVLLGASSTEVLTIGNAGADVTLLEPVLTGSSAFALAEATWPAQVREDGALLVEITFAPAAEGEATGQLTISVNGAPETGTEDDLAPGVWRIELIGTGASAAAPVDADGDGYGDNAEGGDDCDDTDPDVHPGATEVCNGIDDDCAGGIDDGLVFLDYYPDLDGDGFGDASSDAIVACQTPPQTAEENTDCDDADEAVHPDAEEICNGVDDDCSGVADDGLVFVDYFPDVDGDGYGDETATPVSACADPGEGVPDATDCDDADPLVHPDAAELCDLLDADCDGSIVDQYDDLDGDDEPDCVDEDADGDGDPAATDCDDLDPTLYNGAPEDCDEEDTDCDGSLVDEFDDFDGDLDPDCTDEDDDDDGDPDATDCADLDPSIYTGAPEIPDDGIDQDCDGTDSAACFADGDGDGYGDAPITSADADCDDAGEVAVGGDCDDADPLIHPGAPELIDGLDNDCDGDIDDDLYAGTGADGPLDVIGDVDLSATGLANSWPVTSISGELVTVTVDSTVVGLAEGDEVLLANMHGSDAAHAATGSYEFASVASVSVNVVELVLPLTAVFGEVDNADLSDQAVLLQRVPHFTDVTVPAGATLTTSPWDGALGGILAFRATGTVLVEDGGAITVDELGYLGGDTGSGYNCDSFQGESYAGEGEGEGDGSCSSYNEYWGHWINNYGGGGAHITGGGGNHGGGATGGDSWTGGSATPPDPGAEYGVADLSVFFFGSGGGGVWEGSDPDMGEDPGPGGDGAGILFVGAGTLQLDGAGGLSAVGGTTVHWASGSWTYGAAGGAGGTIYVEAATVTLAADSIDAQGGFGESTHIRVGGDGGVGRVRIDCGTCNGFVHGSVDADAELSAASEPDPGFSAEVP